MRNKTRLLLFGTGVVSLAPVYLWGMTALPGFGRYPGPYGTIIDRLAIAQTNATGVVSAINFDYRGFDTVGEEFILFAAATGVAIVLRMLRGECEGPPPATVPGLRLSRTSGPVRTAAVIFVGPLTVIGLWLALHAQTDPSGGFQGGVVLATALILIYLAGDFLVFRHLSAARVVDALEAAGAGGFVAIGLAAVASGLPYLTNFLSRGSTPGAVSSSGTIVVISVFVGVEVGAAFLLIVGELLEQILLTGGER